MFFENQCRISGASPFLTTGHEPPSAPAMRRELQTALSWVRLGGRGRWMIQATRIANAQSTRPIAPQLNMYHHLWNDLAKPNKVGDEHLCGPATPLLRITSREARSPPTEIPSLWNCSITGIISTRELRGLQTCRLHPLQWMNCSSVRHL